MEKPLKKQSLTELRRSAVVIQLASGKSVAKIARESGLDQRWIYNWLRSNEGVALLRQAINDANAVLRRRLPDLVEKALNELQRQLDHPYDPDRRARAARTILTTAARLPPPCEHCCARDIIDINTP